MFQADTAKQAAEKTRPWKGTASAVPQMRDVPRGFSH
jgi:hypothetical protein